jgi:hypothetical protein
MHIVVLISVHLCDPNRYDCRFIFLELQLDLVVMALCKPGPGATVAACFVLGTCLTGPACLAVASWCGSVDVLSFS